MKPATQRRSINRSKREVRNFTAIYRCSTNTLLITQSKCFSYLEIFLWHSTKCDLLADKVENFAQRCIGDLDKTIQRTIELQNQTYRQRDGERANKQCDKDRGVARGDQAETNEKSCAPKNKHDEERDGQMILHLFDQGPSA